jgi:hypothetical protein
LIRIYFKLIEIYICDIPIFIIEELRIDVLILFEISAGGDDKKSFISVLKGGEELNK